MDLLLPDMSGIQCTERLIALLPQLCVVVLTGHPDDSTFLRAGMAGARGLLIKPCSIEETINAINDVLKWGGALGKTALPYLLGILRNLRHLSAGHGLSGREEEVLAGILGHKTDKQIARSLSIGEATVHTHTHRLFKKLKVHSRKELVEKFLHV
jgi:DNA-binding NarL/FixJ family response regulator